MRPRLRSLCKLLFGPNAPAVVQHVREDPDHVGYELVREYPGTFEKTYLDWVRSLPEQERV